MAILSNLGVWLVNAQFNICIFQPCDLTLFDNPVSGKHHALLHCLKISVESFVETYQGTSSCRGKGGKQNQLKWLTTEGNMSEMIDLNESAVKWLEPCKFPKTALHR